MKERLFRFKQFSVKHSKSAMKVGVDGVLVGAWANVNGSHEIIDIGCGCGLIAIMCAQRNHYARIRAVEIDDASGCEARDNFMSSPWNERLELIMGDALSIRVTGIDCIISNPPFFDAGISEISTARELARHCGGLSPYSVIEIASRVGTPEASVSMIFPADMLDSVVSHASEHGWQLSRICQVRGHEQAPVKRTLVEFKRLGIHIPKVEETELALEVTPGNPTEDYRTLCHDFYLKF